MEHIYKEYGKTVIEVFAIIAVIVLISTNVEDGKGNKGIIEILSNYNTMEAVNYDTYKDVVEVETFSNYAKPIIKISSSMLFVKDTDYGYGDVFVAKSGQTGNPCTVIIDSIKYSDNTTDKADYNNLTQKIVFQNNGTYSIEAHTTDELGLRTACKLNISINK